MTTAMTAIVSERAYYLSGLLFMIVVGVYGYCAKSRSDTLTVMGRLVDRNSPMQIVTARLPRVAFKSGLDGQRSLA